MNEIKHIHLGRQQFTISVAAYSELKSYLEAIKDRVGEAGAEVSEEVEVRMAELLAARGIDGKKVVLPKDVAFLKAQLGEPGDFGDDGQSAGTSQPTVATTRRLFRDSDNAMIAGVAAGFAKYLAIDPIIIRLLFIGLTFLGGSGVLIYLVLWLLVPEARTTSDRLSMQGKAATVDNLKQVVERANLPGAARRGGSTAARILGVIGALILFIVGLPLVIAGGVGLLWTVATSVYFLMNGAKVDGHVVAPIGSHEVIGFIFGVVTLMTILLTMLLVGIAMLKRRWQVPAWGVAALVGVFFVSASVGGAFAAAVVPTVQQKVQSLHHTKTVQLKPFTQVAVTGNDLNVEYTPDSQTYVQYSYYGDLNTAQLHTTVTNGKLQVSTGNAADNNGCNLFCINTGPDLQVDIHAPKLSTISINGSTYTPPSGDANQPDPVFFGWHPRFLQQGTVQYSIPQQD